MNPEPTLEDLLAREPSGDDDASLVAAFWQAARESDLPAGERADQRPDDEEAQHGWSEEDDPVGPGTRAWAGQPLRLAAATMESGPVTFGSGAWRLHWERALGGGWSVAVQGAGACTLLLPDVAVDLVPGAWTLVGHDPPLVAELRTLEGRIHLARRSGR